MVMTYRKAQRFVRKRKRQFADSHRRWQLLGYFHAANGRFPNGWDVGAGPGASVWVSAPGGRRHAMTWLWFHRWVEQHESTALERHYQEQRALQFIRDAIINLHSAE